MNIFWIIYNLKNVGECLYTILSNWNCDKIVTSLKSNNNWLFPQMGETEKYSLNENIKYITKSSGIPLITVV